MEVLMTDLLERKVKALKSKLEQVKDEIARLDKEEKAGLLSPIERMKMTSLQQERQDLVAKIKELLM